MADLDAHNGDSNFPIVRDGVAAYLHDSDPEETREWMDSLERSSRFFRSGARPLPHAAPA